MNYFVTIKEVKEKTTLNTNINDNDIAPFLEFCSDYYVKPLFCDIMDYTLFLEYYNENHTWTDEELDILKSIKQVMYWSITYEVILNTSFSLKNKGVQQMNGENSVEVDYQINGAVRKNVLTKKDWYANELRDKLIEYGYCSSCEKPKRIKNIFFI